MFSLLRFPSPFCDEESHYDPVLHRVVTTQVCQPPVFKQ
jgi:hypothetical protein